GATKPVIHTDVCSACHPFFTGEQRIVDTGGRVERFKKRLAKAKKSKAQTKAPSAEESKEKAA
ncbi:MAG: 50S ribosomal protein L31, partial [Chloroflexota bacterium]|nr:50S ribosomal protein L31 [Chloroflexota bacterium]